MWSFFFPILRLRLILYKHITKTNWIAMKQLIDSDWDLPIEAKHGKQQFQGYAQRLISLNIYCVHDTSV